MKIFSGQKNWPYVIGLAGAAAVGYLWLAPRLIKPGIGHMAAPMHHAAAPLHHVPMHRSYPAMAMGGGHISRAPNIVGEAGGIIPLGGGPAGVTGGGGNFGLPSGVRGMPGGYGIQGGYLGEAGGASRLAVA
jgi:hypothetical protein